MLGETMNKNNHFRFSFNMFRFNSGEEEEIDTINFLSNRVDAGILPAHLKSAILSKSMNLGLKNENYMKSSLTLS
jgi:hypothetical protein